MELDEDDLDITRIARGGARVHHRLTGLDVEVCVHPVHSLNVDAAIRSMRQSLSYYPDDWKPSDRSSA